MPDFGELREKSSRVPLKDVIPLHVPFTVFIEPTNICNFRCETCPHAMPDYAAQAGYHQLMDIKLFDKLIGEIKAFGGVRVIRLFFDGESLIHPKIGYMSAQAKSATDRLELITNGSLLTAEKSREILDAHVDYVRISIYGVSQESHERVTGNRNPKFNVNMIQENVAQLRRMRDERKTLLPHIAVNMLHDRELDALKAAYVNIADEVSTTSVHSWGSDFVNISNTGDNGKLFWSKQIKSVVNPNLACAFPFYTVTIRSDGSVVPCGVAWSKELILGNENTHTLLEIWNGEKFEALRKELLAGNRQSIPGCKGCTCPFEQHPLDFVDGVSVSEYEDRWRAHK